VVVFVLALRLVVGFVCSCVWFLWSLSLRSPASFIFDAFPVVILRLLRLLRVFRLAKVRAVGPCALFPALVFRPCVLTLPPSAAVAKGPAAPPVHRGGADQRLLGGRMGVRPRRRLQLHHRVHVHARPPREW
jgi:hypothetical protein